MDFRGANVNFCVFDPQKALPYSKRIRPCISCNVPITGVGCTLVQETQKGEKNAIEAV